MDSLLALFTDPGAWAALVALLDECPVMLANVAATGGQRPLRVQPTEFRFIAEAKHLAAVRDFLQSLPDSLTAG